MQSSYLNANRGIVSHSDQRTKSLDTPYSPQGVVDGDEIFGRQPVDDEVAPAVVACGCFRFWDFFGGNDTDDSFTSILLKDIKLVREDDHTGQQHMRNTQRSRSHVQNEYINDPNNNQIVDFLDDSFDQKKYAQDEEDNVDSHVITMNTETETFQHYNDEHFDNEYNLLEEDNSSESSTLSFDHTDFEEQEFEAGYGLMESNRNFNIALTEEYQISDFDEQDFEADYGFLESNPNFNIEGKKEYLPTIQENIENSFSCDVGKNFNNIFICNR